jgi:hypothetical protein
MLPYKDGMKPEQIISKHGRPPLYIVQDIECKPCDEGEDKYDSKIYHMAYPDFYIAIFHSPSNNYPYKTLKYNCYSENVPLPFGVSIGMSVAAIEYILGASDKTTIKQVLVYEFPELYYINYLNGLKQNNKWASI